MLRIDLDTAGVPYVIDGPAGPLYGDFHAMRHTYVALLESTGASLKQAMQLARHTDPKLTMARYGKLHLEDLANTINRLPSLTRDAPGRQGEQMKATGTDAPVCTGFAQTNDIGCEFLQVIDENSECRPEKVIGPNTLTLLGVEDDCDDMRTSEKNSPSRIRTYNKPVNRRFLAKAEKAQKPREFPTVYRHLAYLQGFSRAVTELHYSSEIPQMAGHRAEISARF